MKRPRRRIPCPPGRSLASAAGVGAAALLLSGSLQDPALTMDHPIPWLEIMGLGLAIALSPLHVALLLLLLLGPEPMRRGGWLVAIWMVTSAVEVALLLTVGHSLLLSMEKGTSHRTGLDLLAAGALLALGLNALLVRRVRTQPTDWSRRLDSLCGLPLLPLLGLSVGLQVATPDDVFLYAKATASLLASHLDRFHEVLGGVVFSLSTSLILLLPLLALVVFGQEKARPPLERLKQWLVVNGDPLVGMVGLLLAGYLGWQGIEGLRST